MIVVLLLWHNDEQLFSLFFSSCVYIYLNTSKYDTSFSFTWFSCLKECFIFIHSALVLSFYIDVVVKFFIRGLCIYIYTKMISQVLGRLIQVNMLLGFYMPRQLILNRITIGHICINLCIYTVLYFYIFYHVLSSSESYKISMHTFYITGRCYKVNLKQHCGYGRCVC